ncbi:HSP20-like chaperone [Lactarius sanguifluus]|nr:HSP20-like chaperone [Lactarius sanguifluus]
MSKHPEVLWAQRSSESDKEKNFLFVTVNLPDIVESSIQYDLQPTGLTFKAQAGPGEQKSDFEFKVDFYKEIIPEESTKRLTSRSVVLNLRKKVLEQEYWPRLTKDKVKSPYIKTDFSKWVDEDEQESPSAALDEEMNFGGMGGGMPGMGGGMPGMGGGMPGMGGIPGLGDLGGGDMDFSKMMASMGNPDVGTGDAGDDRAPAPEGGADSDSDSGPPPLE